MYRCELRTLLLACLAQPTGRVEDDTAAAVAQRLAQAEIDAWDEPNFARAYAALRRGFPKAAEYVFEKLAASKGPDSVKGVATFLARVKTLEAGTDPGRAASREADKKAVELLEKRGITRALRAHLGQLVETALGPTPPLAAMPGPDPARKDKLIALKLAFDEWATGARTVITKRSYLIRLGLASRRAPKADDSEDNG